MLEYVARGVMCSATNFIGDTADGTNSNSNNEPDSQDMTNLAIDLKKVERAQEIK